MKAGRRRVWMSRRAGTTKPRAVPRDRPAGRFALHTDPGTRLVGMSDWRPDVAGDTVDLYDRKRGRR